MEEKKKKKAGAKKKLWTDKKHVITLYYLGSVIQAHTGCVDLTTLAIDKFKHIIYDKVK